PSVQPKAATILARAPRDTPAESVMSAPVPGIATITSEVNRKAKLTKPAYRPSASARAPLPRTLTSVDSRSHGDLTAAERVRATERQSEPRCPRAAKAAVTSSLLRRRRRGALALPGCGSEPRRRRRGAVSASLPGEPWVSSDQAANA